MLKRFSKVTSLLVVAASVVSMVPVIAAETQKVETVEGTVYNGKAIGDGVFFINGEINDEDAVYYVTDDGTYNKIDGLDSGDTVGDELFDQYLEIDDDTYIDEKNSYKVVDDNIRENIVDDASTAVRKKIKNDNDGRFDETYYQGVVSAEVKRYGETSTFLDGFSGKWSHYQYKLDKLSIGDTTDSYSTIYSDLDGNYVDGDYNLGNLKIGTTDDSVTIKNTDDTYEIEEDGTTYELKVEIKENTFLSEAYADLYRTAYLTIYRKVKDADDSTYENVTSEVKFGGKNGYTAATENLNDDGSVTVLQKFSKEQASDDIDGIKYPKSSEIYFITDEDGKYEPVLGLQDADRAGSGITGTGYGIFTTSATGITSFYEDLANNTVYAETVNLKSTNGYNYIDLSDIDDTGFDQVSIVGGDLWALSDGYLKAWDGDESFEKIYKVDGSMNQFSMDNKDNVIIWNEDDAVYSIINNKTKTQETTATTGSTTQTTAEAVNAAKAGWGQATDGTWSFVKADGTKATGWYLDGATWYYLNATGVMQTGWVNDNGTWYYCNGSGAMLSNTTVDGYLLGASGAWVK